MQAIAELDKLSNEQLVQRIKMYGGRENPRRAAAYDLANHIREHSIHIQKLMDAVGAQGSKQTEAQRIMREGCVSLGTFMAAFSLVNDEDLEKSFENQTPRKILEHVQGGIKSDIGFFAAPALPPAPSA